MCCSAAHEHYAKAVIKQLRALLYWQFGFLLFAYQIPCSSDKDFPGLITNETGLLPTQPPHQGGPRYALTKKATQWKKYVVMSLKVSTMLVHKELRMLGQPYTKQTKPYTWLLYI